LGSENDAIGGELLAGHNHRMKIRTEVAKKKSGWGTLPDAKISKGGDIGVI